MSQKTLTEKSPLIQNEGVNNENCTENVIADAENQTNEKAKVYPYPWKAMIVLNIAIVGSNTVGSALNAIFAVYFSSWFLFNDNVSTALTNSYAMFLNFVAPVGGILSDRVLGNYKTQLLSYNIWAVGCVLMLLTVLRVIFKALGGVRTWMMLTICGGGLFFQALGFGMIGPIQSVIVADQFHKSQAQQMETSFSIFYFFLNIGSLVGESVGPILQQSVSWEITVSIFTGVLLLSTVLMFVGGPLYRKIPPQPQKLKLKDSIKKDLYDIRHILKVYAPLPVFWALFYQQNSTWVFQAEAMNTYVGPFWKIPRIHIPPALMPSLEDLFCLLLIFVFDRMLYPFLKKRGRELTTLTKIGIGFFYIAISFTLAGILQIFINANPHKQLHIAWQIPQIFFMACAEISVAIPGLDFAYTQSPPASRGTVTAIWSLTSALGNVLVIGIALIEIQNQAIVFFMYAGMMAVVLVIFILLARRYQYVEFKEIEEEEKK